MLRRASRYNRPTKMKTVGVDLGADGRERRRTFVLGSLPPADLTVLHDTVSRRHALVHLDADQRLTIEDAGSTNGTFVRGSRIAAGVATPVDVGERIQVGKASFQLAFAANGMLVVVAAPGEEPAVVGLPTDERRILVVGDAPGPAVSPGTAIAAAFVRGLFGAAGAAALARELRALPPKPLPSGTLCVPQAQLPRMLQFPAGHPQNGYAYALHPLRLDRYLLMGGFHRTLFEEKQGELLRLLAALGARRVRVRATASSSAEDAAQLDLSALGGFGARLTRRQISALEFEDQYAPTGRPHVPADLVWYQSEPTWQQVAERRLQLGLRSFKGTLSYASDFGITAELAVQLASGGFRLGAEFKRWQASTVEFEADFD